MSAKSLKKMIKKFEERGYFEAKSGKERRLVASTSVQDLNTALGEETVSGVQLCRVQGVA